MNAVCVCVCILCVCVFCVCVYVPCDCILVKSKEECRTISASVTLRGIFVVGINDNDACLQSNVEVMNMEHGQI